MAFGLVWTALWLLATPTRASHCTVDSRVFLGGRVDERRGTATLTVPRDACAPAMTITRSPRESRRLNVKGPRLAADVLRPGEWYEIAHGRPK